MEIKPRRNQQAGSLAKILAKDQPVRDFDVQERWRQKEDEDRGKKDDEHTEDSDDKKL